MSDEHTVTEYVPLAALLPPIKSELPLILVVTLPELELFETIYVPVPPFTVMETFCP
jgi:hypothetical protein